MIGFGATGFSPYSQWWGNNAMGQGVQTNPVPDNAAEVNQLQSLGQQQQLNEQRNRLMEAMLRSGMFRNSPLTSMALSYLGNGGQGLGLGSKIMSGIKGLFGG